MAAGFNFEQALSAMALILRKITSILMSSHKLQQYL